MSFDTIIQALREGADSRREMAADALSRAAEDTARAEKHGDVAESLDLLADARAPGRLTKHQLRYIVVGPTAEYKTGNDSGLCPTHGHPLDERGMCPVAIDLAPEPVGSIAADAFAGYTDAQLDGFACIHCGRDLDSGRWPNHPVATGPRGQVFAHSNPDDCKAVTS